jgi:hypothetical protein
VVGVILAAIPSCSDDDVGTTETSNTSSSSGEGGKASTGSSWSSSGNGGLGGAGGMGGSGSTAGAGGTGGGSSSTSSGNGLVFVHGSLETLSISPEPVGEMRIVNAGFEYAGQACGGSFCVYGGLIP